MLEFSLTRQQARPLRLELEDGVYHVLSRGNFRADIFRSDRTKAAFLKRREDACGKRGGELHAWCLISNHYHLAVSTPQAKLVKGMPWLKTTNYKA